MINKLEKKKIKAIRTDNIGNHPYLNSIKFDMILCLNVLDRCCKPISLVKDVTNLMIKNKCQALFAVVFPFYQSVENG